jgi:pilus assembly protein CpaC
MINQTGEGKKAFHHGSARQSRLGLRAYGTLVGCCVLACWALGGSTGAQEPVWKNTQPVQLVQAGKDKQPDKDKLPEQVKPGELPPPKPFEPFGPKRPRLPRLPGLPRPLGTTPIPDAKTIKEFNRFVEKMIDPENTLELISGQARIMLLKETPKRIQVVDENIVSYNLFAPKEITILGRAVGSTIMNMWFDDPVTKQEKILSWLVRVLPDPEARERLERVYEALADEINQTFPDSFVVIRLVGDKLLVTGQAKDIAEATQILRIVRANAPAEEQTRIPVDSINISLRPGDITQAGGIPGLDAFLLAGGPNVINLLRVPGEQQVMLKVVVAEVNRTAARSIGLSFSITNNQGVTVFANNTAQQSAAGQGVQANLPIMLDGGQIPLALNALKTLNYARSLAEPNLVAINGQTASFQAGGQFPIPVVTGATAAGLQGVSFVPFGVQLQFTPFITDKDRIRLIVAANVSTRDPSIGTNIGNAGVGAGALGGTNVPGLNTRNFQTTVEMREGQTMAVAGLIQTNLGADTTRIPFLGQIPLIGQLTGFTQTSHGEQELVILVTPELVHPMNYKEIPPLPGSDLFEPSDLEFYVCGRIESRRSYDYRTPVMTDIHRMFRYHHCEQIYLFGPTGHSIPPGGPGLPGQGMHTPEEGPLGAGQGQPMPVSGQPMPISGQPIPISEQPMPSSGQPISLQGGARLP